MRMKYAYSVHENTSRRVECRQRHARGSTVNELAVVGLEWLGTLALFLACIVAVRYLEHRERMSMIERGLVPPSGGRRQARRGSGLLRGGLITMSVGIAVTVGLYNLGYLLPAPFSAVPDRFGPWLLPGLIPTAVGVALVASYYLAPPRASGTEQQEAERDTTGTDDAGPSSVPGGRPQWRVLDTRRKDELDDPPAAGIGS